MVFIEGVGLSPVDAACSSCSKGVEGLCSLLSSAHFSFLMLLPQKDTFGALLGNDKPLSIS